MDVVIFIILIGTAIMAGLMIFPLCRKADIWPVDEGYYANAAWLIYRGKHPYRDFYLGYTPAKAYFTAWLFRLLGPHLSTARLYYCAVTVILTTEIVFITYLIVPVPSLAFLMGMVFLISLYPRSDLYRSIPLEVGMFSDRTAWALAFMISLIAADRMQHPFFYFLAGMLLVVTTLWGQEAGIWAFFSGILFFLCKPENYGIALPYLVMGGIIPLVFAGYYAFTHEISLKTVWMECFRILLKPNTFQYKRDYPSLFASLPDRWTLQGITDLYRVRFKYLIHYSRYYWPLLIYTTAAVFLLSEVWISATPDYAVLLPLCYGIGSLMLLYSHPDYFHIIRGMPIQLPVTAYVLRETYMYVFIHAHNGYVFHFFLSFIFVYLSLLFFCVMVYDLYFAIKSFRREWNKKDGVFFPDKNVGCFMKKDKAEELSRIRDFLKTHSGPSENILVLPADPLLYFLNKRESPVYMKSFFAFKLDHYHNRACQELARDPVTWIIYNRSQDNGNFFPKGITFPEFAPALYNYLAKHYTLYTRIGTYDMYKRTSLNEPS